MEALRIVEKRKVAAIVGACAADAAAQPLQWIYKDELMLELTNGIEEIEFRTCSANPYFSIETGRNTCYYDQAYVMLKSLVESGGLNVDNLTQATYDFFGPDSEYENKDPNIKPSLPIHSPWRNGCLRDFLVNLQAHKSPPGSLGDDQIDCAIRIIPLVALYAGRSDMLLMTEIALRILQDNDIAVTDGLALARVLEQYILYGNPEKVLETVITQLNDPNRANPQGLDEVVIGQIGQVIQGNTVPHVEAVSKLFKKNCHLPQSMLSSLHGVITAPGYVEGVRSTIRAGGCCASRSGFIGACMAAKEGIDAVPEAWKSKTFRYEEVLAMALKLVQIKLDSK